MSERPRTTALRPDQLNDEQRRIYDDILSRRTSVASTVPLTDDDGGLVGPFDLLLRSPAVGDAAQRLGAALRADSTLSDTVTEAAILTTAAHWHSDFETYAHSAIALAKGSLSQQDIDNIGAGQSPDDEETALACGAARQILADGTLDDSAYAAATAQWGEQGVTDLVCLVGYYSTLAMLLGVFAVGAPS